MFGRECRYGIPFFIRNNVFLYNVKAWRCVKRGGRIVLTPPRMLIWMKKDGSEQTQMTFDETRNSWFPHVSPDGKSVIFITY